MKIESQELLIRDRHLDHVILNRRRQGQLVVTGLRKRDQDTDVALLADGTKTDEMICRNRNDSGRFFKVEIEFLGHAAF